MWDKRETMAGLMFFAHDYPDFVTEAPRDEHGIHIATSSGAVLQLAIPALPRGLYMATWRFRDVRQGGLDVTVQTSLKNQDLVLDKGLTVSASGHVRVVIPLEAAANLNLAIQGCDGFKGVFKDFTIARLSPDPSERAMPDFSRNAAQILPSARSSSPFKLHHCL
jgi:hypothetical protein